MAKITITIDTENKSLAVSIDGVAIPNAKSVNAYQYRDSDGKANGIDASIQVSEDGPSEGVRKETSYYAMGTAKAEQIVEGGGAVYNDSVPNFVRMSEQAQIQQDIANFLGTKLSN